MATDQATMTIADEMMVTMTIADEVMMTMTITDEATMTIADEVMMTIADEVTIAVVTANVAVLPKVHRAVRPLKAVHRGSANHDLAADRRKVNKAVKEVRPTDQPRFPTRYSTASTLTTMAK